MIGQRRSSPKGLAGSASLGDHSELAAAPSS